MSNSAVALKDMYSVDHFKGKEAIGRLDKAATLAMTLFEEHSSIKRENKKVQSKKQKEEDEEAYTNLIVVVTRQSDPFAAKDNASLATDSLATGAQSDDSDSDDNTKDGTSSAVVDNRPKETINLPDELVVPLFCIFHNYLAIVREANNTYLLGKMTRVKRCIAGIFDVMNEHEAVPLTEKNIYPPFGGIEILLCGIVSEELALTNGEVHAMDAIDNVSSDEESEGEIIRKKAQQQEEDADLRKREAETMARRGARRGRAPDNLPVFGQAAISNEEEAAEEIIRKERAAKKAKYERQRKLDATLRKQTIKNRMKLYHLIDSGKITKIFANKSSSVLAEDQNLTWGDAEENEEADAFMEDSTQATSSDESSSEDEEEMKRRKKEERKADRKREKEEAKAAKAAAANSNDESVSTKSSKDAAGSGDGNKKGGFLSFLFRNRDTA